MQSLQETALIVSVTAASHKSAFPCLELKAKIHHMDP